MGALSIQKTLALMKTELSENRPDSVDLMNNRRAMSVTAAVTVLRK